MLPPDHVTFWMTVSSPEPVDWTSSFHPGASMNESIENPAGGVSSTLVVLASSFSVGTASVKTSLCFAWTTEGLTWACAHADEQTASAITGTASRTAARNSLIERISFRVVGAGQAAAGGARAPARAARNRSRGTRDSCGAGRIQTTKGLTAAL